MKLYTEILRDMRENRDLKQSDIAAVLGTTQQHYSKYETGKYEIPMRSLSVLADYYHVSVDYLMGRTDCKQGVDSLNSVVVNKYTVGRLVTDIMSLNESSRRSIVEYVELQILKEKQKISKYTI